MTQLPSRQRMGGVALIIFLATVVVYAQVVSFDFTNYDDHFFVTENLTVQRGVTLANILWAFSDFSQGSWQPLTWISHMVDCQLFGLEPSGHHLVNAFIHAVNSAVLCYVLTLYTGALGRSLVVAALFAVHPLHVESVAWISERRDVLSGMWFLLSLWRYKIWSDSRQKTDAMLVALCFLGGLMSKPIVVTLPVILLLADIWPLRRLPGESLRQLCRQWKQVVPLIGEKIPLFFMALLSGLLTIVAEEGIGSIGSLSGYPMTLRLGNAALSYVRYLGKTLWPTSLIPFYTYPEVLAWQVALALVTLVLISVFCVRQFRNHPYLLWGWLWYLVMLLPVIGIIQQGEFSMADRYTYLPLIGIFVMLVWGGGALVTSLVWWRREWTIAVAACLVVILSALTIRQTAFWRDTPTLFGHTLQEDPDNFKALLQLGAYHRDGGELELAQEYFLRVISQSPKNWEALSNLGDVYGKMGQLDEAERYFQRALELNPGDVQVYMNLGVVLAKHGQMQKAALNFERALGLQPDNATIRMNFGGALYLSGKLEEASEQFVNVLRTDPASADAYNGLGLVAMERGQYLDAVQNFQEAVRINPQLQSAQENLRNAAARVRELQ